MPLYPMYSRMGGFGRIAAIHFLATVGASVPAKEILEGGVGVKSGRGRVVASLASRSTSLLRRMSVRCCPSHASDSWRWLGIKRAVRCVG